MRRRRRPGRRHHPRRLRARDRALPRPREGAMLQVALAPCAPFNVTKRLMVETVGLRSGTIAGCTPISPRRATRSNTASSAFLPPGRLSRGGRLDERSRLARPRHPFQRRRGAPARPGAGSASAIARPRTWCWRPASAARGNSRPPARPSASASTARPPTTIPT